ncbi:MAG: hypothetical protein ACJAVK_001613 [Akkermansiaceae bacterium]|jgi:hypothetical protein
MNTNSFENRLRVQIKTAIPRPGFETRIQAMAREPYAPEKKSLVRRFVVPALAVLAIAIVVSPKDKPAEPAIVAKPEPLKRPIEETVMTKIEEPVQKEIEGLKNDAKWTLSLFKKALPSIPVGKKEKKE